MTDIDTSNVEAGEYVLVVEAWDQITSKPNEPYDFVSHHKGDVVELDRAEARRLVKAGAVVTKAEYEKAAAGPAAADTAISVLDAEGLANLREKLDLDEDADQDAILAALEDALEDVTPSSQPGWWGDGDEPTTIPDIEEAVGDDKARAAAALAAEYASSSPRKTLIEKLTGVLAGDDS